MEEREERQDREPVDAKGGREVPGPPVWSLLPDAEVCMCVHTCAHMHLHMCAYVMSPVSVV
jgi:hypothetical protein